MADGEASEARATPEEDRVAETLLGNSANFKINIKAFEIQVRHFAASGPYLHAFLWIRLGEV
jgi:hypothetical protein